MNTSLIYFYTTILFIGMICSCFQSTILQFSKSKKEIVVNFEEEDIEDNEDNSEKETEKNSKNEKKEVEEKYVMSCFNHLFFYLENTKTFLQAHIQQSLNHPDLDIYTPPPKV